MVACSCDRMNLLKNKALDRTASFVSRKQPFAGLQGLSFQAAQSAARNVWLVAPVVVVIGEAIRLVLEVAFICT